MNVAMKLYFNTKLITLTIVTSLLILGVVFFIGLELGRIAGGAERIDKVNIRSEKITDDVEDSIKNVQEADLLPGQPLGSGE